MRLGTDDAVWNMIIDAFAVLVVCAIVTGIAVLSQGCAHERPAPVVAIEPDPSWYRLMRPNQGAQKGLMVEHFGIQYRCRGDCPRVEYIEQIIEPAPSLGENRMGQRDPKAEGLEDTL